MHQWNEDRSESGVVPCELNREGGEDRLYVASVFKISRAEEGSARSSICKSPLRDCLCDGALSRSGESVQPVDRLFLKVVCPDFDFIQDGSTGSPETAVAIAVSILGLLCRADIVEDSRFNWGDRVREQRLKTATGYGSTWVLPKKVISWPTHARELSPLI